MKHAVSPHHGSCFWVVMTALLLTGCMGGSIARQVAQSVAMQVADNAVGRAVAQSEPTQQQTKTNQLLMSHGVDPYQDAFLRAQLRTPTVLPQQDLSAATEETPVEKPAADAQPKVTQLATLEIWGVVIGDEKQSMLEMLRDMGIVALPPEKQWDQWQLAEGGHPGAERPMLILVPPEVGKVRSGDFAVVESGLADGFYLARDRIAQ